MEAGATEMVPVLYHAHQEALACCQCIIAAIRRSASCMNIPPALAPLFSCEPRIEHPDKHHLAVKDVLLEAEHLPGEKSTTTVLPTLPSLPITQGAREAPHPVVVLDHEREVQLWARHQAFVSHVRQSLSASAELLVDGYKATFAGIDNHGAVHVTDLDEFRNAIYHRLRTVLFALFAPVTTASLLSVADLGVREPSVVRGATCDGDTSSLDPAEQPPLLPEHDLFTGPAAHQRALALRAYQTVADRLFSRIVESSPRTLPRKGIHNRLQLYLTTPPSRNLFLLHHPHEGITLTSTIAIAAMKQLFAKPFAYATALHSTRAGVLSEEPTDVREVMVHILSQLTTHPDVLRYLRCEVDAHRLKRFFINFLSGSQIRPDESQPAMLALSALGAGARPSQGTGKETGSGTATTVNVMTVPMPEITAKTLQHAARELVEDTTSKRSAHEVPAFTAEDANRIFVVLLDGLDDVVEPVEPCAALRQSPETGADEWSVAPATADGTTTSGAAEPEDSGASGKTTKLTSTGAHQSTNPSAKVKQAQLVSQEAQRISFLPACLARNVRLIATCTTDPAPHLLKVLTARGRDSVDTFAMPSTTVNETEMLLSPSALEPFGIALSDDGLVLARDKTDSQNPEYLHYLTDALRTHFDVPGSQTLLSLLKAFPATVDGAARRVHAQLRARFGDALVKNAIGLISASRWGLVESDLRALLQLPPKRFNEFLRVLRPALDSLERLGVPPIPAAVPSQTANGSSDHGPPHAEDTAAVTPATSEGGHFTTADSATVGLATQTRLDPNCSGNVIQRRIRLASPAFLRLLRQEELLADEEGSASAAEQRTWHQTLAQYYHAVVQRSLATERHQLVLSATPANGSERQAVKELIYHAARGGLWTLLDRVALSFPFMMLVYRHQLAYAYVRDLVFAFNTRHEAFLLGENEVPTTGPRQPSRTRPRSSQTPSGAETQPSSTAVASAGGAPATTVQREATLPTALLRMRSYIFFARQYSAYLTEFPHLVLQAALERSPSVSLAGADVAGGGGVGSNSSSMNSTLRMVQYEAADYVRRYFYWQPAAKPMPSVAAPQCGASAAAHNHARVFFRIANERKSRVHLGAVTACAFSPNSRYVVTGSTDRSVAWVQPATGSVLFHGRHSSARIRQVIFAETSAYVMAVAEDRTLYIYDTAFGKLVSRNDGAKFDSPIAAIQFSVRGRYYIVGLEDFTVHVFSTERSHLIGSVPAASWQTVEPANDVGSTHRRAHLHILPDPAEEKRVHVFANELVQSWSVDALGEGVECVTQAHRTSLSDSLASAQWYPVAAMVYRQFTTRAERSAAEDPQHREREEARHSLAVSGRYALLLPLHRAYVSLYDMASHTEVARAHPANLNGQCWRDDGAGVEASLSVGCPVTVVALAAGPSHGQWLAVAGSDGSVTLYDVVRCVTQVRVSRQLATATVNTLEPVDAPVHTCFAAFRASATHPRVVGLAFALDDTALVAISDSSHVLYWSLEDMDSERPSALAAGGEARWQAPLLDVGEAGHRPSPRNDADGEFRLDSVTRAPLTCWSARPTPRRATESASDQTAAVLGEESAPLLALGDAEGQVVLLELWKPTA